MTTPNQPEQGEFVPVLSSADLLRIKADCHHGFQQLARAIERAAVDAYKQQSDETLRRVQRAALRGMDAAKRGAYAEYQAAHRLRAESKPEVLDSERAMNALLTDENEQLCDRIATLERQRGELERDRARFDWYFGQTQKAEFVVDYLKGCHEKWSPDQWRAAIDAALAAQEVQ